MKNLNIILGVVVLTLTLLTSCNKQEENFNKLTGKWMMTSYNQKTKNQENDNQANDSFENIIINGYSWEFENCGSEESICKFINKWDEIQVAESPNSVYDIETYVGEYYIEEKGKTLRIREVYQTEFAKYEIIELTEQYLEVLQKTNAISITQKYEKK